MAESGRLDTEAWLHRSPADIGLYRAGIKVHLVPPDELSLPQILQRMMGYNIVAVLNQFVTAAAFPGATTASNVT